MIPARIKAPLRRILFHLNYARLRQPKRLGPVGSTHEGGLGVAEALAAIGLKPTDLEIDVRDYRRYLELADYAAFPRYYAKTGTPFHAEKSLEHYVSARLLDLKPGDVYIDIANAHSPTPEIYRRLYGASVYRQDLIFPPGLSGDTIGGDAAAMPVPDGFATKMAMHCSFEHFEGDSDWRFIREAGRVLRPGGRLVILPLYLFTHYAIQTDPGVLGWRLPRFEPDAIVFCARGYRNRHGRFYDAEHLRDRVIANLRGLRLSLYRMRNSHQVDPSCYLAYAAVFEKP